MARRSPLSVACAVFLLTLGGPALASPSFPGVLEEELQLSCQPSCTVCHQTDPGLASDASQVFADSLRSEGLFAGDTESLRQALQSLGDAGTDSDGDGVGDVEELTADQGSLPQDPSQEGAGAVCGEQVHYGCAAGPLPASPSGVVPSVGLLGLLLLLRVKRHAA